MYLTINVMKKSLLFLLLICSSYAFGQGITGDWYGQLDIQGTKLRVVFHIVSTGEGYTSTMDSPDQGAKGIAVDQTTLENGQLTLQMTAMKATYKGVFNDAEQTINGTFDQGTLSLPLELKREAAEKTGMVRPQEPHQPFPYYSEDVTFRNKAAKIDLAGTLTLPDQKGRYPVVVLISGSGPQNRDEEILGHKPFLVLADYLTRNGIGVLRFDDRGTNDSGGSFATATSADFATDVEAALAYLKTRKDVDKKHLGLMGHSEGGMIAPMVASRSGDVAFVVLLAGPGIPGDSILQQQQDLIGRAMGSSEEELAAARTINRSIYQLIRETQDASALEKQVKEYVINELKALPDSLKGGMSDEQIAEQQVKAITTPWFRYFLSYDPVPALEKTTCPVLALNGSKDLQVPSQENLSAIEASLKKGGNGHITMLEMEGLNHLFQQCATGSPEEYAAIEQSFSPEALEVIGVWVKEQVK
jgi:uncharacterized protein